MKKIIVFLTALFFFLFAGVSSFAAGPINGDGYFKNIRLAGKVRVVDSFPDIRVQVVDSIPCYKIVLLTPIRVGKWWIPFRTSR